MRKDENDTFYFFLAYYLHLVVENNIIIEPLYPLHSGIILSDLFVGIYGTAWYSLKSILRTQPDNWEWFNRGRYTK